MMIFILPAVLVALTVHEFSHAISAYKFGDRSALLEGRLSLNPVKHIDPTGFLMLLLLGFGWAKPVVYDPSNIKHKKLARVVIAIAGPLSNLLLGIVFAMIYGYMAKNVDFLLKAQNKSLEHLLINLVLYMGSINFGLGIFNLIPIAPLDGSHVLSVVCNLNRRQEMLYMEWGMPILLVLICSDLILNIDLLPIHIPVSWLFKTFAGF